MLEKPLLRGTKVLLRPIDQGDADAMFASLKDEEAMRLTGTQESFSLAQTRAFCDRVSTADDRADYAICLPDNPRYLGEVVLNSIDWNNKSANFRIALAGAENRNKGYGSEAAQLMLDYGFKTLKLHRISLEVFDFNARALHLYKKLGFVQEGILRDALLWDGSFHHAIVMSLLEPDYHRKQSQTGFTYLETERLCIRRLRDEDLEKLVAYRSLPEVSQMQLWDSYSSKEGRDLITACKTLEPFTAGSWFQFGVALKTTDELIGDLYFKMDETGKQAEIGYSFDPQFQAQGLATEAVKGLINHAFLEQGLHRIYGLTDPRHKRSIALMQRIGMRQEALLKENLWFKGEWADDVVFAILEKEWKT